VLPVVFEPIVLPVVVDPMDDPVVPPEVRTVTIWFATSTETTSATIFFLCVLLVPALDPVSSPAGGGDGEHRESDPKQHVPISLPEDPAGGNGCAR